MIYTILPVSKHVQGKNKNEDRLNNQEGELKKQTKFTYFQ